jgi:hypothetical protein
VEAVSSLANIFHAAVKGRATSHYSDCFGSTQSWPRTYERRKSRPREDAAAAFAAASRADDVVDDNVCMKKQRRSRASPASAHACSPPAPGLHPPPLPPAVTTVGVGQAGEEPCIGAAVAAAQEVPPRDSGAARRGARAGPLFSNMFLLVCHRALILYCTPAPLDFFIYIPAAAHPYRRCRAQERAELSDRMRALRADNAALRAALADTLASSSAAAAVAASPPRGGEAEAADTASPHGAAVIATAF